MFVPFSALPASARIWIYQANRPFTTTEIAQVEPALQRFAAEWTSHGRNLEASAAILHHQFLVVGLNEAVTDASGCSIDASVRFVRLVEEQIGLQLLEKSQLAFLIEGKVELVDRRQLRQAIAEGRLTADTPYFDNTVAENSKLGPLWPAPAATTWLAKYF